MSLATPLVSETVRDKWFDFPRTLWLDAPAAATCSPGCWLWRSTSASKRGARIATGSRSPAAIAIFVLAFLGLAYSIFPYVVIDRLTIWEAAAHPRALKVVLVGTAASCCRSSSATRCFPTASSAARRRTELYD